MRISSRVAGGVALALLVSACSSSSNAPQPTAAITAGTSTAPSGNTAPNGNTAPSAADTALASSDVSTTRPTPATSAPTAPSPSSTPTTVSGGVDPNAPEVVEPGDIPDNQVFIRYSSADGTYTIKVPEGWARTEAGGVVTFTDKYNSIVLLASSAAAAPTVESVKANGLADVSADPTFTLVNVKPVKRHAGTGVLATYEVGSAPNAVTGKKALLAVERYVFFHNGTVVTMTLAGAKGADNVDPWKIVSDSLSWP